MVNFTNDFEHFKFVDPLLMKFMYLMQSCDSSSYTFWNNQNLANKFDIVFQDVNIKSHQIWYEQKRIIDSQADVKNSELEELGYY